MLELRVEFRQKIGSLVGTSIWAYALPKSYPVLFIYLFLPWSFASSGTGRVPAVETRWRSPRCDERASAPVWSADRLISINRSPGRNSGQSLASSGSAKEQKKRRRVAGGLESPVSDDRVQLAASVPRHVGEFPFPGTPSCRRTAPNREERPMSPSLPPALLSCSVLLKAPVFFCVLAPGASQQC